METVVVENEFSRLTRAALHAPRQVKLRVNVFWSLAGTGVYSLCQLGILVVLAKMGTHEMLGQFALGLAIASPVMICAGLSSLRIVHATDAHAAHRFQDYLALRILTSVGGLLAIAGIVYFAHYSPITARVVLMVGVAKAIENLSDVFGGLLQHHERMDLLAFSTILRGTLSLLAMAISLYVTGNVLVAVSCLALSWALTLIFFDLRVGAALLSVPLGAGSMTVALKSVSHLVRLPWNWRALSAIGVFGLPVIIAASLVSLTLNIPRYFIEYFFGVGELGKFAALAYPMAAGVTIINAIGQSAMPRLARQYAYGDCRQFAALIAKLAAIATVLGGIGVAVIQLAGRPILTLLYRPEYVSYVSLFLWLAIGTAVFLVSNILGYGVNAVRHFRIQMFISVLVALVAAVACALLVPRWNLTGAAIAIILAASFQAAANVTLILYALRVKAKGVNA